MITVDWQHIILAASGYSGTSRRIARMRNAGAHFAPAYRADHWVDPGTWMLTPEIPQTGWAREEYSPPFSPLPPDDPYGNLTYIFAFWSVMGSSPAGTPLQEVYPSRTPAPGGGPWTLNAKAWYVWNWNSAGPGGGQGEHFVEIDAFSRTNNDFIPDYFVDVEPDGAPDPGHSDLGPLTYTANEDGYLGTEKLEKPISITARDLIGDRYSRYQFVQWQVIPTFTSGSPMPAVNGNTITIPPRSALKAYAIYDVTEVNIPEVEILPGSYVLVVRDGLPVVRVAPDGGIDPGDPFDPYELQKMAEMLQQAGNDLRARLKL